MARSKYLINKVTAPALPVPPQSPVRDFLDSLTNIVRLFFNQISGALNFVIGANGARFLEQPYALMWDDADQPLDTINVGQPIRFNQTYLGNGVTINGLTTSEITVEFSGIYEFQFTGQVRSTSSSSKVVYVWISRDGLDVGYTAREYSVAGTGKELEIAWDFIIDLQAGQHIQLMWTGNDIDLTLDAVAPTSPHPGIPSAVVAVTFVSALPETLPTPP